MTRGRITWMLLSQRRGGLQAVQPLLPADRQPGAAVLALFGPQRERMHVTAAPRRSRG